MGFKSDLKDLSILCTFVGREVQYLHLSPANLLEALSIFSGSPPQLQKAPSSKGKGLHMGLMFLYFLSLQDFVSLWLFRERTDLITICFLTPKRLFCQYFTQSKGVYKKVSQHDKKWGENSIHLSYPELSHCLFYRLVNKYELDTLYNAGTVLG